MNGVHVAAEGPVDLGACGIDVHGDSLGRGLGVQQRDNKQNDAEQIENTQR